MPVNAPKQIAASRRVLAIGPGVSCVNDIGTIPDLLSKPTVGLIPTIPLLLDGQTIEPLVSVPIAITHRFADTATPDPALEPLYSRHQVQQDLKDLLPSSFVYPNSIGI